MARYKTGSRYESPPGQVRHYVHIKGVLKRKAGDFYKVSVDGEAQVLSTGQVESEIRSYGLKKVGKPKVATAPKAKRTRAGASAKQTANRRNLAAATALAVDLIYEAGRERKSKPTWGKAIRAVYGSGTLSGTPKRKATKRK